MKFDTKNKTSLTEGGEGIIYELNKTTIVKIYKQHINLKSKQRKAELLIKAKLPVEVIKPLDIVTDNKGKFIGISMKKVCGEDFKKLSNKKFVTTNNINTKDILEMLSNIRKVLKILHKQNIFIGDLNDQNILFDIKTKNVFFIDTDSWSIGNEKCEVAMDLFKDPKLFGNDFNSDTDTYAFCVLAWKSLTRIHPFGGTTSPDMQIIDRINKGISVIDNQKIKIPKIAKTWRNLSPDMIQTFKGVFNDGSREIGNCIDDMLMNLSFCKKDKDYYFGGYNSCPICNIAATIVKKAMSIGVENGFKIAPVLNSDEVKTVYSENIYLNKQNEIVDLLSRKKVVYVSGRYLFDNDGNIVICHKDFMEINISGNIINIPIQYNSYPVVFKNCIYYISDKNMLTKIEIVASGLGRKSIQKCSANSFFKVHENNFCIVNIYDKKIITNIDGYYCEIDFDKKILSGDVHYDSHLDRWLLILEDSSSTFHTYIIDKNTVVWRSNKINYKCQVYNVCFDRGVIYIPVDDAIRGMSVKTLQYKDFKCSVVNSDSKLIKKNNQFIIINDENIYRFYK